MRLIFNHNSSPLPRLIGERNFCTEKPSCRGDLLRSMQRLSTSQYGDARETNRNPDARPMEAHRYSRIGLATHLAAKRSGSRKKDCPVCEAIRIPAEILH